MKDTRPKRLKHITYRERAGMLGGEGRIGKCNTRIYDEERQTYRLCKNSAGAGTHHRGYGPCKFHGGISSWSDKSLLHGDSPIAKYIRKLKARELVNTYGLPRNVDPQTALLEEIHRTAGHVAWLAEKVANLSERELVWGLTKRSITTGDVEEAKPNVWLTLYDKERKHLAAISKAALDIGLAERQVQVAEQQGILLAQVIRGVLNDLGVLNHPDAPHVVRKHLTTITLTQANPGMQLPGTTPQFAEVRTDADFDG